LVRTNTILFHSLKEQKVFTTNLKLLRKRLSTEAIHDLRVAVKKLNAYCELYILLQKQIDPLSFSNEELLNKTNELFDTIGRQRDVEICIELIDDLQKENDFSCPEFIHYLRTLLNITKAWSRGAIHQFRNKEIPVMAILLRKDKQHRNAGSLNQNIESVINLQLAELTNHFGKPHRLRKKLKSIFYWLSLVNGNEKYRPELLNNILDELGNWQNWEVLQVRLKHFRKDYLAKPFIEYDVLKKLELSISEKKKKTVKSTRSKTKKWLVAVMTDSLPVSPGH
jgi:CHAD domain-containing protein